MVRYRKLLTRQVFLSYLQTRLAILGGPSTKEILKKLPKIEDELDPRLGGVVAYVQGVEFAELTSEEGMVLLEKLTKLLPITANSTQARSALRKFLEDSLPKRDIVTVIKCMAHIFEAIHRAHQLQNVARILEIVDWTLEYFVDWEFEEIVKSNNGWEQYADRAWHKDFPEAWKRFQELEVKRNCGNVEEDIKRPINWGKYFSDIPHKTTAGVALLTLAGSYAVYRIVK